MRRSFQATATGLGSSFRSGAVDGDRSHEFQGPGGKYPGYGNLVFDTAGHLYGTTEQGGANDLGVVFELSPVSGGWTETVLHSFQNTDGKQPQGQLIFDASGNLYGTAYSGGLDNTSGSVFELSPSGDGWTFAVLHLFDFSAGEGAGPLASVTIGSDGNLCGTTLGGGSGDNRTIYGLVNAGGSEVKNKCRRYQVPMTTPPSTEITVPWIKLA